MSMTYGNQDPYNMGGIGQLLGQFLGQKQANARQQNTQSILGQALSQQPNRGEAGYGPMDGPDSGIERVLRAANQNNVRPDALQQFMGMAPGVAYLKEQALSKDLQKSQFAAQSNLLPKQFEMAEKQQLGMNALQTIQHMQEIGKRGNLGRGSAISSLFGGESAKDAGHYERLGKSLISFSSPIIIRNKKEFEILAGDLYDPSISDARREGILEGMKEIITQNVIAYGGTVSPDKSEPKAERKPLAEIFGE